MVWELQGIGDGACMARLSLRGSDDEESDASITSFYRQPGCRVNAEAALTLVQPEGVQFGVNLTVGSNSLATQPLGLQFPDVPVDIPQLFIGHRFGPLVDAPKPNEMNLHHERSQLQQWRRFGLWIGRFDESMGRLSRRPDVRNSTRVDPSYSQFPFTQQQVRFTANSLFTGFNMFLAISAGPDTSFWDSAARPFFIANFSYDFADYWNATVNLEAGAIGSNNNRPLAMADVGLQYKRGAITTELYGVVRASDIGDSDQPRAWGAGIYMFLRPDNSPIGLVLRGSYTEYDSARLDILAGVNLFFLRNDNLMFRVQAHLNHNSETEIAGIAQVIYRPFTVF